MHLYKLNKQNIELSKAEVLALAKKQQHELVQGYLLLDKLVDFKRLAYTKKVYEILFETNKDSLFKDLRSYDFNTIYKESFRLRLINNPGFKESELADIMWQGLNNPKTDLKNAGTKIDIIFLSEKRVFCCQLLGEKNEKFEDRKAHLRPYNHPTSLHPRLARCMVNLAASKEILDPFCGSGGILIEAGLIGLNITGYDLYQEMIERAKKNLEHYNIEDYKLESKNSLNINQEFESIVTDLPYGKNSKAGNLEETYKGFLNKAKRFVDKIVVGFPDFTDNKKIIRDSQWNIKNEFTYYIHKSMNKKIFVLVKD